MVKKALSVRDILLKENINPTIVNARFLKPMDEELLSELLKTHSKVVTIEDNIEKGGLGSNILLELNNYKFNNFLQVFWPTIPSAESPLVFWNSLTAE